MWRPYLVEPKDKVDQWGQRSLEIFRKLAEGPSTGMPVRPPATRCGSPRWNPSRWDARCGSSGCAPAAAS
ncbi:hypothetical protein GCM10027028_28590 [Streptomyces sundarbansensis]